jgi:hypothetical protein
MNVCHPLQENISSFRGATAPQTPCLQVLFFWLRHWVGYENEKVSVSKYFETGGFTNILPHGKKRMSATVQNTSKLAFYFCIFFFTNILPHGNKRVCDCFS